MNKHAVLIFSSLVAALVTSPAVADINIEFNNQIESDEVLPLPPSEQELIELQTLLRSPHQANRFGLFDIFKSECRYAIKVPDAVTRGTISLTFDDGPNPDTTPLVLDVLKAHNAKATFFVLGGKIKGNENLVRRIVKEGHHLGNHSYSHANFQQLFASRSRSEIKTTDSLLRQFTAPTYLRFPYGFANCTAKETAHALGYKIVGWNIDTCDWAYADGQVSSSENAICQTSENLRKDFPGHVLREVNKTQGGILLMHDIHRNTAQNLDRVLSMLEKQGYKFVPLDDPNIFARLNDK